MIFLDNSLKVHIVSRENLSLGQNECRKGMGGGVALDLTKDRHLDFSSKHINIFLGKGESCTACVLISAHFIASTHPVSIGRKQDLQYMRLPIFFVRTNVSACQKHDFSRNLMLNRGTLFDVRW